jgi:methoxymalonate biosynthesis acyl carrier protein
MDNIKERVRLFLLGFFKNHELTDDENIFASGYVNSLFAMQLIMFLEQEFEIQVDSDDLDLENLETINVITNLVARKLA